MAVPPETGSGRVRTAEVIAALSLATDLATGMPLGHGLRSALVARRLCDRLAVDSDTAAQAYYFSLLFYVGCTAPADVGWEAFGDDDSMHTYALPVRFGSRAQMATGFMRAVAPPTAPGPRRAWRVARHLPVLAVRFRGVVTATCEVAQMLTDSLGLSSGVSGLFEYAVERWDGKGLPGGVAEDEIPMAVRVAHVARDAVVQQMLGDEEHVAAVIGERSAAAFDPLIASLVTERTTEILDFESQDSLWDLTLDSEPQPWLMLDAAAIEEALAAMGHFSDMVAPEFIGHSDGVSDLCRKAAARLALPPEDTAILCRAASVHDLGRVAVPTRIWQKSRSLTIDDWEQVRLHAYHTERILSRSPFLAGLIPTATLHHERLDGSGYHRGVDAQSLPPLARLLATADAYHAMTETRPHRGPLSTGDAAQLLAEEARAGRLASDTVTAVLEAAGHPNPPIERPSGLTEREVQVVSLLARGLQTKQVARRLQISPKTADFHIQNSYRKMGVSTRAGATLFAMQHGLTGVGAGGSGDGPR